MNRRKKPAPPMPAAERTGPGFKGLVPAVLLFVGTLLVYAQVWEFGVMTVDDGAYVSQNAMVQQGLSLASVKWSFTTVHDSNWIPLTWLSLMLDTSIYGLRPGGYHLTNAILHAINAVLVFAVFAKATNAAGRSAFVAALFALHPLHVESVAWIAERKDVLSTFFGLLSLLTYVGYARLGRWRYLVAAFVFFAMSLMSKQTLVTLPFVFLLMDYWPLARFKMAGAGGSAPSSRWRLVGEKIPFFAATGVFCAVALAAQSQGGAVQSLAAMPMSRRVINALGAYAGYLAKTVYPHNLAVYYPQFGEVSGTIVAVQAVLLLAITAAVILSIRRYPFLFVGWFWYLGTLVPMIGLIQIGSQQMADRYTYFPLIGIFLGTAWLLPELIPDGPLRTRILPAAAIAMVLLFAATTFSQISYWHDSVTLLRHSLESTPDNSVAHEFLGTALITAGDAKEGVLEIEKAIHLAPQFAPLYYTLGFGLERLGRLDEAADQYRAALAIEDRLSTAHLRLGAILFEQRHFAEARKQFHRAIDLDPSDPGPFIELALLGLKTEDYGDAIVQAKRALALDPYNLVCQHYIGLALRGQGHIDEAIHQFEQLVRLAPQDELARQELAETLDMKQRGSRH